MRAINYMFIGNKLRKFFLELVGAIKDMVTLFLYIFFLSVIGVCGDISSFHFFLLFVIGV
jgi:hypothetical protein